MICDVIKVGDKLFSTVYGEVSVSNIIDPNGYVIYSTNDFKEGEKDKLILTINLPTMMKYNWESFSVNGYSMDNKSTLQTLFKNKEDAIKYLTESV